MNTSKSKPTDEQTLREWAQHWPFRRASQDLIRRAQRVESRLKQRNHEQAPAAPF